MKHSISVLFILLLTLSHAVAQSGEFRTFTNTAGKSIQAKLVGLAGDQVTIEMAGGKQFTLGLNTFVAADQEFVRRWSVEKSTPGASANAKVTLEAMNIAAGQPLFIAAPLWTEKSEDVAARLKWPDESSTKFTSSYRSYPAADYKFFGAHPFSAVLYAEDDKPTGLSLVYANKGDLFGRDEADGEKVTASKENLALLDKAIESDSSAISAALTKALGPAKPQRFGDGSARRKVSRWDWKGHAFLLQEVEREYVSLTIDDIAFADGGGKITRVPQSVIRSRSKENVERRPNGDVVITNIPMVDQGPKGYCVPATCERCLRYVGMTADMYVLAMVGQGELGGGTSVTTLLEGLKPEMKRKGRNFTAWQGELKFNTIAKHVDDGIPIIWVVWMTKPFSDMAYKRTTERFAVKDWAAWKTRMQTAAKTAAFAVDENTAHATLIIGYNKDTGEIAISDSWGEHAAERWVTLAEAEQVSLHQFFVIGL